jgi:hypothetical protein
MPQMRLVPQGVSCHELFGDGVLNPVFDLQCDFTVCRWIERVEQVVDLRCKGGLTIMITRSIGHGSVTIGSVMVSCIAKLGLGFWVRSEEEGWRFRRTIS